MHLCISAHTIPIHFHHKSPQPGGNIQSICGPRMSLNSSLMYLYSGVQMEGTKTGLMERVCEPIRNSSRQLHEACESLFPTTAFHRWRRWLHFIPDDDCNDCSFRFHRAFLEMQRRLTEARHVRQATAFWTAPRRTLLFLHFGCRPLRHKNAPYKNNAQKNIYTGVTS